MTLLQNSEKWEDDNLVETLFDDAALREAREEIFLLSNPDFEFTKDTLKRFGAYGEFRYGFGVPDCTNREHSTLYVAFIPKSLLILTDKDDIQTRVRVEDSSIVDGRTEERAAKTLALLRLSDLCAAYMRSPDEYADGVGRVLSRLNEEPGSFVELNQFIDNWYTQFSC
jgi:hypothetical protein